MAVTQVPLPDEVRRATSLPRVDYTDTFLVTVPSLADRSAEQWARRMLDQAPTFWRWALPTGWHLLGLEHGEATEPACVLGWPIAESTEDHVVLAADGHRGIAAELVVVRRNEGLMFATFVHQRNLATRILWAAVAVPHRVIVTHLLKRASQP